MWRSFFMAVGAYVCILGAECLVIDKAVLASKEEPAKGSIFGKESVGKKREFVPPDWTPWSLMSAGAITVLYSITIQSRAKDSK